MDSFAQAKCGLTPTTRQTPSESSLLDQTDNPSPDIVTMAKPLANGFPIGAILVRDQVASAIQTGSHGTTFGGQPLATRLGHYVLSRLSEPSFLSNLHSSAAYLDERLQRLPDMFEAIKEVRGRGMIRGVGLKDHDLPGKVVKACRERGVLLLSAGADAVRFVPPLIVTKEEVGKAIDVLESVLVTMSETP